MPGGPVHIVDQPAMSTKLHAAFSLCWVSSPPGGEGFRLTRKSTQCGKGSMIWNRGVANCTEKRETVYCRVLAKLLHNCNQFSSSGSVPEDKMSQSTIVVSPWTTCSSSLVFTCWISATTIVSKGFLYSLQPVHYNLSTLQQHSPSALLHTKTVHPPQVLVFLQQQ
ncbi:hypothetical protein AMECASPLE_013616 [Ameca splendens]|uniref:Uncharacterized protein n=1 Tax=Ameca splendens TaxID=208324 RepID=A0ABV0YCK5_9TELE